MDGKEFKARRLFKKNEWKFIMSVLYENRDILIKNYNCMLQGGMPEKLVIHENMNKGDFVYHKTY